MNSDFFDDLVVVKRSGQRVSFNGPKIAIAIKKAFDNFYINNSNEKDINKMYASVLKIIKENYENRKTINVEDIQDIIENELKKSKYNEIYESFKIYREKRAISRELCSEKEQHKFAKATTKLIDSYNNFINDKPLDLLLNFGKTISLEYTKSYLLETKYVRAHDEGRIFINNLEFLSLGTFSSCHFDFSNIKLENFFKITNLITEITGEVSIPSFDYLLENYLIIKFKNIYEKNVISLLKMNGILEYINFVKLKDDIKNLKTIFIKEELCHYMLNQKTTSIFECAYENSISVLKDSIKNSLKFFFINLNNRIIKLNDNRISISFGTNNSLEGIFINDILLNIIDENELYNINFIYKIYKDDKLETSMLNKILYLIQNNKNIIITFIKKKTDYKLDEEYFSDGTIIYNNVFDGKQCSLGRMIIDSISINLATLGIKNRDKNIKEFYKELDDILELSKNALITLFEFKSNKYKNNFKYLFSENVLIDSEKLEEDQKIRKILKQGILNIEIIGLKECVLSLNKSEKIDKKDCDLGLNIISYINKKINKYTDEEKLNFALANVYNSKSSKEFVSIDKSIYGIIKNITDKNQYDVLDSLFKDMPLEERIQYESKFQKLFNGGYVFQLNLSKNNSTKDILKYIELAKKSNINFIKFKINKKEMLI